MSSPTPETTEPGGDQNDDGTADPTATDLDPEVSKRAGGQNRRKRTIAILAGLVVLLGAWTVYDRVRAPDPETPPTTTSTPTGTPSSAGGEALAQDTAVTTALNYTILSYAGKWPAACQLRTDQATCLKVSAQAPTRPLLTPAEVLKTEDYPATGVAGQPYTGVLVSADFTGATSPALLAYLVNQQGLIAGKETVSSTDSTLSLRQILERHIK